MSVPISGRRFSQRENGSCDLSFWQREMRRYLKFCIYDNGILQGPFVWGQVLQSYIF